MKSVKKPKNIDDYIKNYPIEVSSRLETIRQIVRKVAPEAVEVISYSMPAFKINGGIFVYFSAHAKHIGLYPYPSAIKAFKKESAKYKTGPGTIQFPYNQKLPVGLITKIVKFRHKEKTTKKKVLKK